MLYDHNIYFFFSFWPSLLSVLRFTDSDDPFGIYQLL